MRFLKLNMIYNKVNLTESETDFITSFVLTDLTPWYKQDFQTDFDPPTEIKDKVGNTHFFSHALMLRNKFDSTVSGKINSDHYYIFEKIFLRWINENNITPPNIIYRASLNLTTYYNKDFSVPHYDHEWPHWNWIMYLNDTDADTLLFDKSYKITESIAGKRFHACAFENTLHAHKFPKINEARYVVVFTFV